MMRQNKLCQTTRVRLVPERVAESRLHEAPVRNILAQTLALIPVPNACGLNPARFNRKDFSKWTWL